MGTHLLPRSNFYTRVPSDTDLYLELHMLCPTEGTQMEKSRVFPIVDVDFYMCQQSGCLRFDDLYDLHIDNLAVFLLFLTV